MRSRPVRAINGAPHGHFERQREGLVWRTDELGATLLGGARRQTQRLFCNLG